MAKKTVTETPELNHAARLVGDILRAAGNEMTTGGFPDGISRGDAQNIAAALMPIFKNKDGKYKTLLHALGSL